MSTIGPGHIGPPIDFEKRVAQFVKLRDLIKKKDDEHKEQMRPIRDLLEKLNSVLLDHLNQTGAESAATLAGTVYKTSKKSASMADKSAFWAWVVATGDWDLIDFKANPVAVEEFINKQVEAAKDDPSIVPSPPPGINYSVTNVVGVRRK